MDRREMGHGKRDTRYRSEHSLQAVILGGMVIKQVALIVIIGLDPIISEKGFPGRAEE